MQLNKTEDTEATEEQEQEVKYETTPRRWLQLSSLLLMLAFNHFTYSMYIPIIQSVQAAYLQPSPFLTSMNVLVWRIQAVPMNFVSIWLYKHYSVRYVLTIAATLQIAGGWIRSYAILTDSFWPILLGTTVLSCSMTMLMCSQMFIINKWFPVEEFGRA